MIASGRIKNDVANADADGYSHRYLDAYRYIDGDSGSIM